MAMRALLRATPGALRPARSSFGHGVQVRSFAKRMTNRRTDLAVRKRRPGVGDEGMVAEVLEGTVYVEPSYETWVHSMKGEKVSIVPLETKVFDEDIRTDILHRNVLYWQNKERGWSNKRTLRRGEISGTGKKPHKQKGTGRARQGTKRAPHHRGGGKAHGPVPRSFETKLNKKVRQLGNRIALAARFREENMVVLEELKLKHPKTHAINELVKLWGWNSVLFVQEFEGDRNFELACKNIPEVETVSPHTFNAKEALLKEKVVLSVKSLEQIQNHLCKDIRSARSAVVVESESVQEEEELGGREEVQQQEQMS